MLSFRPTFSLSCLTFIKRLFSSSSFSAIRAVSAYLRLLIFLPAILIPASASSSLVFHMIYSASELNKQGDNKQLWHTPFPIWKQSVVPCLVLTVPSWPAYRFFRRQLRWSGISISWRIFLNLWWFTQPKNALSICWMNGWLDRCMKATSGYCFEDSMRVWYKYEGIVKGNSKESKKHHYMYIQGTVTSSLFI